MVVTFDPFKTTIPSQTQEDAREEAPPSSSTTIGQKISTQSTGFTSERRKLKKQEDI